MKSVKLTSRPARAQKALMEQNGKGLVAARSVLVLVGLCALPGCITVNAPDKPIVIELNINIQQEVLYKIAGDVDKTIEENADIF